MDVERGRVEYVLPLKWSAGQSERELPELAAYLRGLCLIVDVTVVDGSDAGLVARHAEVLGPAVRVLTPRPWPGANGKVRGVVTGVRAARHEVVVVADDDVRYDAAGLARVTELLADADLVRPQNVFQPLPWHARWDTGRSLLNRALRHDHPGTFALRRSTFLRMGGYDGDVLFENLELSRTVAAAGGREVDAPDLFVARRPPTARHFAGQRVRQAYDSLATPGRLAAELSVLPVLAVAARRRRLGRAVGVLGLGTVALAEVGRRRAGGSAVFGGAASLWAPLWLAERSVCSWLAVARRLRGGVPYAGGRLRTAAHPTRQLRRTVPQRPPLTPLPDGAEKLPG
jgi:Glycosyltransferase like family 2